jgi:hypothetical protein
MYQQGRIPVIWTKQDYQDLDFLVGTRDEMCKRLTVTDAQDMTRYSVQQFSIDYYDAVEIGTKFVNPKDFDYISEQGYSVHRTKPGHIVPEHIDHYAAYRRRFDLASADNIIRVLIFLEDWQPGHYLDVNGRGFVNWQAGDWVSWQGAIPHRLANLGSHNRYTFTITGILK